LSTSTPSALQCLRTFSKKRVDDSSVPWGTGTSAGLERQGRQFLFRIPWCLR
jgi:hypothetical protein